MSYFNGQADVEPYRSVFQFWYGIIRFFNTPAAQSTSDPGRIKKFEEEDINIICVLCEYFINTLLRIQSCIPSRQTNDRSCISLQFH